MPFIGRCRAISETRKFAIADEAYYEFVFLYDATGRLTIVAGAQVMMSIRNS